MNSFLKGFFSVFNLFPSSKSYDDTREEVDEILQHDGWGEYTNSTRSMSCDEWNNNIKKVTQSEFLDKMIKLVPIGPMVPHSFHNEDMDAIQVYFKDHQFYTQPLNEAMNLYVSFDTNEVIGVEILNVKKLLEVKILP